MKRRRLLVGTAAVAGLGLAGAALWKPGDQGGPHDAYFSRLNELLKTQGPGRPVMLIDGERFDHNIDSLTNGIADSKTYRAVVKSLPSLPLLQHVLNRTGSESLMVFHQPFLNEVARVLPQADVLLGKPMPVQAVSTYFKNLQPGFDSENQVQWLIDSQQRLDEYIHLAKTFGVRLQVNLEIDLGLHRGGFEDPEVFDAIAQTINANSQHVRFSGFMGYEPHLAGVTSELNHPAVQRVLDVYRGFVDRAKSHRIDLDGLTINGAGSHTIRLYDKDNVMNDLSAGSGLVKPSDFDTLNLTEQLPAVFIATPILKHYRELRVPGDPWFADLIPKWDPNTEQLYYLYGGKWQANVVSPPGAQDWMYKSSNQSPIMTSRSVDLEVNDYMFLRPTQSEHVMLQFGDLLVVRDGQLSENWPVFHETG